MKRRGFLKTLFLGAAATGSGSGVHAAPKKRLLVQKTIINGMAYYDAEKVVDQISYDDPVHLKREPGNPHDRAAVEVFWEEYKLGYVPRLSNFALAKMLDNGETVTACIAGINARKLPYSGLEIEIVWEG